MPEADESVGDPGGLTSIAALLRDRGIRYPLADRGQFVEQMCASPAPVVFQGQDYQPEFAANLVPDFLFPIDSEQDMLVKVTELLVSRGLLPLDGLGEGR